MADGGENEDDDYMSDAFLASCVQKDVRPGLKRTHALRREHELSKKRCEIEGKAKKVSSGEAERDQRDAGLSRAIETGNKGFEMLKKMGYKQGDGLGKNQSGIVEPISISVKSDRQGLGREALLKELHEEKRNIVRSRLAAASSSALSAEEFRHQMSLQRRSHQIQSDLFKSQKACEELDRSNDVAEPADSWFWPRRDEEEEEEEEEDEEEEAEEEEINLEPHEKLLMLTRYLRREYFYCLWCGTRYDDLQDLESCPGQTREDHDE